MSFIKKFGRQKSVDLEEEAKKKEEKEKAKELKRSKRHSVQVSATRDLPENSVEEEPRSKDDSNIDDKDRQKREAQLKERERRKFKDMSGMVMTSPNEYPVFIVHYLGRMPADAEYGREAVEEPVHQLCKLREKQKLPKTLLAFNVDGMMCREVSGPFLKPKKEGLTFFIPLHHITYGVGSLTHPQVFAIITKMTDDPSPANQVLVLHAFLCDKPEEAQALTYWQLQAYIEAFEDLKRKRMLKMRRKQAMGKGGAEGGPPGSSAGGEGASGGARGEDRVVSPVSGPPPLEPPPPTNSKSSHSKSSKSKSKSSSVKPKRTNSVTSTTSSSSSSSSSKRTTPIASRKSSESSTNDSQASEMVVNVSQRPTPGKLSADVWPPKRGPPAELRGPPPAFDPMTVDVSDVASRRSAKGSADSRDSAFGEGDDEFPATFFPGPTSPPPAPSSSSFSSSSMSAQDQSSSIPGIRPRKSSESTMTFESRINELQSLVDMDAEKLKNLMINEYPTLSR
ncbi:uncharacterized protein [Diadema setosum]|uniref:uncharacterized protein n=1 Tax=Diadema setosum TaxID=31175 RepID=UPI003B3B58FD